MSFFGPGSFGGGFIKGGSGGELSITQNPSSVTDLFSYSWTNPTNGYTVNGSYATGAAIGGGDGISIQYGGLDFSGIPGGATIQDITVRLTARAATAERIQPIITLIGSQYSVLVNSQTLLGTSDAVFTISGDLSDWGFVDADVPAITDIIVWLNNADPGDVNIWLDGVSVQVTYATA